MAFFASPAKPWLIQTLHKRNGGGAEGLKRTRSQEAIQDPSQGLPDDPERDIEEAVKEIMREVELRRRRGSVGVTMPKGEGMRRAVEEKLGRKLQ